MMKKIIYEITIIFYKTDRLDNRKALQAQLLSSTYFTI